MASPAGAEALSKGELTKAEFTKLELSKGALVKPVHWCNLCTAQSPSVSQSRTIAPLSQPSEIQQTLPNQDVTEEFPQGVTAAEPKSQAKPPWIQELHVGEAIAPPSAPSITPFPPSTIPPSLAQLSSPPSAEQLELDPQIIDDSPVLQRWLDHIPDVLSDIRRDPSFRTRLRLGYSYYPSSNDSGILVGVEDIFIGQTGLTLSGDYQTGDGNEEAYGADLRYYLLPLGSYVNVAPVLGYRHLTVDDATSEGVNLGARLLLSLSRTGAADLSLTHTWIDPGSRAEASVTTVSFGYAVTRDLRLSTDVQRRDIQGQVDGRLGIGLEWML